MTHQQSAEIPFPDPQDALVDKGSAVSYSEARDILDMPQPDSVEFTADAIRARIAGEPIDPGRALWLAKLGLSAPSSEYSEGAPRATQAQKAATSKAVAHLKTLTHPTKE